MPISFGGATAVSLGAFEAVPAGSTNGTVLGVVPSGAVGVRFYLPVGSGLSFTVAVGAPSAAPDYAFALSEAGTGPVWDEAMSGSQMIYVTSRTGAPLFRWFLRFGTVS